MHLPHMYAACAEVVDNIFTFKFRAPPPTTHECKIHLYGWKKINIYGQPFRYINTALRHKSKLRVYKELKSGFGLRRI